MKIKKIQLKNGYKRFFDLTIDLGEDPKRIIALVGANGCGKSSVLDGMLFKANSDLSGGIGNADSKGYEYHSMNKDPKFDHSNITIEFVEGSYDSIKSNKEDVGRDKTIFSFRSSYRYNSSLRINDSRRTADIKLNNDGAATASGIDDRMEENYRRLHNTYSNYLNDEDCRPTEAKAKIIGDLNKSIKNCLGLEIAESSVGDIQNQKGTLYFTKPDHPEEFDFNVLSSGEKEVVDIILDLHLRRDEYDDTIFLIDEPELHINTAIQKKLLIEIDQLIGKNCQIWIATHSIGFLRALKEELKDQSQIIQFSDDANLASELQVLQPIKNTILKWREIFEVALDDLAHLVTPKKIFYCEGRGEPDREGKEQGLDAQVFNNIFSEKYPDVLFVSSGGNTEPDQRSEIAFKIMVKIVPSIEIYVLKDRDISSGQFTSEQDRKLYLENNPTNHRVLKRWEIENYLYDKEVLKKYCMEKELQFDESKYDESFADIENNNLKDRTGEIKKICRINTKISPEKFKLNLSLCIHDGMKIFSELENCIFLG
jgi:predicted ATPase